ncbi:MAG: hypothetical protein ACLTTQ_05510 [Christensenellales bacterium]
MNKWIKEEWSFRVEVTDGYAKDCRLGLEKGDVVFLNMKLRKDFAPVQYLKYIHIVKSFAVEGILPIVVQKKNIR